MSEIMDNIGLDKSKVLSGTIVDIESIQDSLNNYIYENDLRIVMPTQIEDYRRLNTIFVESKQKEIEIKRQEEENKKYFGIGADRSDSKSSDPNLVDDRGDSDMEI